MVWKAADYLLICLSRNSFGVSKFKENESLLIQVNIIV